MKKVSLYIMALLSMGLVSCNQDFETIFSPQTNMPESQLQVSDVTVANNTPASINLADYFDLEAGTVKAIPIGTATVKEGVMPANTILKAEVEFSKDADFANSIILDANSLIGTNEISVNPSQLQDAYFSEITRNPATTDLYIRTVLYTVTGGTAEAIIGKPGENYYAASTVKFTPLNKVQISPAYYVIGAGGGWSADGARTQKFSHSDTDVYEDPIFTVTVDTGGDDVWFAIADDAALDAIAYDNDWTKLLGTKGLSEDLEGTMDYRYNLGGEHSFHVTGATKIRITINMIEYSYTIQQINFKAEPAYYYVGAANNWSDSDKTYKFTNGGADPFENPVYTCIVPAPFNEDGTRADNWFKIAPESAYSSGDFWNNLFGVTTDGDTSTTGELAFGNPGAFCQPAADGAKFYRISINAKEMTYEIAPLNFSEFIYVPGNAQKYNTSAAGMPEWGWTPELAPALRSANFDGKYEGFAYMDGEFKFTKARDWSAEYNYDSFTNYDAIFTGNAGTGGNINCTEPGYYKLIADVPAGSLTAVKLIWGLVGPATPGGWDASAYTVMEYNMADDCWEITTALTAGEFKFTTNGSWDINLGGTLDDLAEGEKNLSIAEDGTYTVKLYPSRAQSEKMYATIVKK